MDTSTFFIYPTSTEPVTAIAGFLTDLGEAEWGRLLSHMQTRHLRPREIVLNEGDLDRALYLLTAGRVEIGSSRTLGAPTTFNEVSFLDGGPSPVGVRAASEAELLRLTFDSFEALAAREPALGRRILFDVGRILCAQLRAPRS